MLATYQTKTYSPLSIQKAKAELELRKRRRERDETLEAKRVVWREKPEVYALERLKVNVTDEQKEILYSIKNNRYTAVKSHHSFGKTFICAIALLWWIDCWKAHIGYITAPTWGQALRLTFKQAKRLAMLNNLDFDILNTGIIRDKDNFTATERFIQALNSDSGEGFQGEHTAPILLVKDESVGVPTYIHDAGKGLMTDEECRTVEISNATDESGEFGDNCSSPNYEVFSFSALEHPNIKAELKGEERPYPKAISLLWLFEQLRDECEESDALVESCFEFYSLEVIQNALKGIPAPDVVRNADGKINHALSGYCIYKPTAFFEGRVLGEFPTEASTKVIPKGWIKSLLTLEINPLHIVQIGSDVARFGDDRSTAFSRIGSVCLKAKVMRKFDGKAVASAIRDLAIETAEYLKQFGVNIDPKKILITVDITGGLGTEPLGFLLDWGYNAVGINASESAKDNELFFNKRSELWFITRDRIKYKNIDISRLPPEVKKELTKELAMPTYEVRGGKKVVEPKEKIKKRLKASPDLADGFNLAFYESGMDFSKLSISNLEKQSPYASFGV